MEYIIETIAGYIFGILFWVAIGYMVYRWFKRKRVKKHEN